MAASNRLKTRLTFAEWIDQVGPERLARVLRVNRYSINHWKAGRCFPRVHQMRRIKELAQGAIGYDDIIDAPAARHLGGSR